MIDIKGLSKGAVLAALYNASRPLGMGFVHYTPEDMTPEQGNDFIAAMGDRPNFDYLKGRVMKVDLSRDEFDPRLYDRDNGNGAATRAIDAIRPKEAAAA